MRFSVPFRPPGDGRDASMGLEFQRIVIWRRDGSSTLTISNSAPVRRLRDSHDPSLLSPLGYTAPGGRVMWERWNSIGYCVSKQVPHER